MNADQFPVILNSTRKPTHTNVTGIIYKGQNYVHNYVWTNKTDDRSLVRLEVLDTMDILYDKTLADDIIVTDTIFN